MEKQTLVEIDIKERLNSFPCILKIEELKDSYVYYNIYGKEHFFDTLLQILKNRIKEEFYQSALTVEKIKKIITQKNEDDILKFFVDRRFHQKYEDIRLFKPINIELRDSGEEMLAKIKKYEAWANTTRISPDNPCILVLFEKHGNKYYQISDKSQLFKTALYILNQRIEYYGGNDDLRLAEKIVEDKNELAAWGFLHYRSEDGYQYEEIEKEYLSVIS